MSEFQNHRDIKRTRKDHQCSLCFLTIPKGSSCSYMTGRYDGEFYAHYDHHECIKEWQDMNADAYYDEWLPLECMDEFDGPYTFSEWKDKIRETYDLPS